MTTEQKPVIVKDIMPLLDFIILSLWFYLIALMTQNRAVIASGQANRTEPNFFQFIFGVTSAFAMFALKNVFAS